MFLLDTHIVSELRRQRPHGAVLAWLENTADQDLHLSAVTLAEIQARIEITREQDAPKAAEIKARLDQVSRAYNILPAESAIFRQWEEFMHRRQELLIEHALIAATALDRGLAVVTRNVADFEGFGVGLLNPFSPA